MLRRGTLLLLTAALGGALLVLDAAGLGPGWLVRPGPQRGGAEPASLAAPGAEGASRAGRAPGALGASTLPAPALRGEAAPTEDTDGPAPGATRTASARGPLDLSVPARRGAGDTDPAAPSLAATPKGPPRGEGATGGGAGAGLLPSGLRADRAHEVGEVRENLAHLDPQDDLRPGRPPEEVLQNPPPPKPDERWVFQLRVEAGPVDGAVITVNGVDLGPAPVVREVRLPAPGDLLIRAAKPGYAVETRQMRLGRAPADGRLEVRLELKLDLPEERPTGARPAPTRPPADAAPGAAEPPPAPPPAPGPEIPPSDPSAR